MKRQKASPLLIVLLAGVSAMQATQAAQARTYTVLDTFAGGTNGQYPEAGLVMDAAGNLYGTTSQGSYRLLRLWNGIQAE